MGGGGGGGSDNYENRQASIEAKKQRARNAVNAAFGVMPSREGLTPAGWTTTTPDGKLVYNPYTGHIGGSGWDFLGDALGHTRSTDPGGDVVDQAGYQAAIEEYNQQLSEAEKNKAARDALYGTVRQNAFDAGRRRFDETRQQAARDNKFALFAQGLNGGSVDIDESALLGRTYTQGLVDLGAKADAARTDMQSSDEQARLGLLQSVDAGMDQSSALSSALQQMKVNADRASSQAQGTAIGDLFADAGLLYTKSQAARGQQAARDWWNPYGSSATKRNSGGGAAPKITTLGG